MYIYNSRHLARIYARIFFRGHYLFRDTVFQERSLRKTTSFPSQGKDPGNEVVRKTVTFKEQRTSQEKDPSIFLSQMEIIVFIILQINFFFFLQHEASFEKNGRYHSDILQV